MEYAKHNKHPASTLPPRIQLMVSHKAEDGNSAQLLVAQAFDDACDITFPIIILYSLEQVHQVVVTHPVRF